MADASEDFVTREKRNFNKKTEWGKPDPLSRKKRVATKRVRCDEDDEENWRDYENR